MHPSANGRGADIRKARKRSLDAWLTDVKRQLPYRIGSRELLDRLHALWEEDFVACSEMVQATEYGRTLKVTDWSEVEPELIEAADRIQAKMVNSDLKEPIDYEGHADTRYSVIAVGGDKLSRRLTLESLSVSWARAFQL